MDMLIQETFVKAACVVSALSIGIIILTLFFTLYAYVRKAMSGEKIVKMENFINDDSFINVHLVNGKILERMKLIGFTSRPSAKVQIPFQLANMAVLENEQGLRTFLQASSIKMIEEIGKA